MLSSLSILVSLLLLQISGETEGGGRKSDAVAGVGVKTFFFLIFFSFPMYFNLLYSFLGLKLPNFLLKCLDLRKERKEIYTFWFFWFWFKCLNLRPVVILVLCLDVWFGCVVLVLRLGKRTMITAVYMFLAGYCCVIFGFFCAFSPLASWLFLQVYL